MKKLLFIVVLAAVLLCGCSGGEEKNASTSTEATAPKITASQQETKSYGLITVNGKSFPVSYENNKTSEEFQKLLPAEFKMTELNGNEKYVNLKNSLPADETDVKRINAGDIMLYGDNCAVIFYDSFDTSYKYTKIGSINETEGLKEALGSSDVTVKFN